MHVGRAACYALLPNLVSVRNAEEDARPEYMSTAGSIGGLLNCVTACDGPLVMEGLRRDGACEHGVLQHRAAGEAPLHEPPHVCLLMHVGAAQASSRL